MRGVWPTNSFSEYRVLAQNARLTNTIFGPGGFKLASVMRIGMFAPLSARSMAASKFM